LSTTLVEEFGWGFFNPQQLQKLSEFCKNDITAARNNALDASLLEDLAAIGADGGQPGNMARDLVRNLPATRLPDCKHHRIPVAHKVIGRGRPLLPFLYPHELFAAIYHNYPAAFSKAIAPPGECERFWSEVSGGPGRVLPLWERLCGLAEFDG